MKCAYCGRELLTGDGLGQICNACKGKFGIGWICEHCGCTNPYGTNYCGYCGIEADYSIPINTSTTYTWRYV